VARIDASESVLQLQFVPQPPIDAGRIIDLIQKHRNYKLAGPDRLRVEAGMPEVPDRIAAIKGLLRQLA